MSTQPDDFMFVNTQMAIKKGLGDLVDAVFAAKTSYAKKIQALITLENEPENLKKLNDMLADVLVSQADLDAIKAKLDTVGEAVLSWMTNKMKMKEAGQK